MKMGVSILIKHEICMCICVCVQVDAIEYYSTTEKDLLEEVRKQVELVPQHPLGMAFVTLQTEANAKL